MRYQGNLLLVLLLSASAAMAQGHDMDMPQRFAFGQPAEEAAATRTIHVEASDAMQLKFDATDIHRGEVVRFIVHNSGQALHEFSIGDDAFRRVHQPAMRQTMAGMHHHAANVLSLKGGETATLVWRFEPLRGKALLFACYVPGHFEAGMYQRLELLPPAPAN